MPSAKGLTNSFDNLKVLVAGPAGTGKSVFASTAPTPGYVIDTGKEILSYKGLDFDYDSFAKEGPSWTKLLKCVRQLKDGIIPFTDKPAENFKGELKKYETIILDNASSLTDIAMLRAMDVDKNRDPVGGPLWNVHYKMVTNLTEDFFRLLLELDANVIVTAHIEKSTDSLTGRILADLRLQGRLSDVAPQWFDEVLYGVPRMGKGGKAEYMLQTVNHGFYKARSRISGKARLLPDYIPNEWDYLTMKKKYDAVKTAPTTPKK